MSDEPSLSVDRVLNSLPGRVLLVVLAAATVAVVTPRLFQVNVLAPFLILRWSVVALVGVVSGLASRYVLGGRIPALRLWAALLASLIGLVLLGLTTEGAAGALLPDRTQAELNWTWLLQFALSALLAWLTLNAYPPALPQPAARRRKSSASKSARPRKSAAKKTAPRRGTTSGASGSPRAAPAAGRSAAPKRGSHGAAASGRDNSGRSTSATSSRSRSQNEQASTPSARSRSPRAASQPAERPRPRIYPAAAHPHSLEGSGSRNPSPSGGRATPPPASGRSTPSTRQPAPRSPADTAPARRTTQAIPPRPVSTPAPAPRPASARPPVPMRPPASPHRREPLSDRLQGWNTRLQSWWRTGVQPTGASTPAARPAGRARQWPGFKRRPPAVAKPAAPATPNNVRLVGAEEHRCPFCLELVEPEDPRGIVECQVCHTQHHADCWEITGACQVPHYHG